MIWTGAYFSPCQRYRYSLMRKWDLDRPDVVFIGFNPSTADAHKDDPTIRRCIGFAKGWGYGGLEMVNLFAWRERHPDLIAHVKCPIGEYNDGAIERAVRHAAAVVPAWWTLVSSRIEHRARAKVVLWTLSNMARGRVFRLGGLTKERYPRHPLYAAGATPLVPYWAE